MANVKPEINQLELQQNDASNDIEKRLETVESNVDVQKPIGMVNEVQYFGV